MLNADIVERGIFVDVEMRKNDPLDSPRMIGVLADGKYTAYACDEIFRTSVAYQNEHKPAQNWLFSPAADIFSDIMHQAEREDRKIVAYSEHEMNILKVIFPDQHDRIENLYFNANVKQWFKKNRGPTYRRLRRNARSGEFNRKVGLKDFLTLNFVPYQIAPCSIGLSPAKAIGLLEGQLNRHGDHSSISKGRKADFTKLYTYNKDDCCGMQALLQYCLDRTGSD